MAPSVEVVRQCNDKYIKPGEEWTDEEWMDRNRVFSETKAKDLNVLR